MRLHFDKTVLDTRGMPAFVGVYTYPPSLALTKTQVHITLVGDKRTAVEKWAKRLGVEVTEEILPIYPGDPRPLEISAVVETENFCIKVYARAAVPLRSIDDAGKPVTS